MRRAYVAFRSFFKGGELMAKLDLKIRSLAGGSPVIKIDGKRLKFRKNRFGNYNASCEVSDGAVLSVCTWDPITDPLWLLWEMLYFVFSIFGILDIGREKFRRAAVFEAVLHPSGDGKAAVTLLRTTGDGAPAAELSCDFEAKIIRNEYCDEKKIRSRRRIITALKIATWIAIIAIAISVAAAINA